LNTLRGNNIPLTNSLTKRKSKSIKPYSSKDSSPDSNTRLRKKSGFAKGTDEIKESDDEVSFI